ncbi:cytochrome P450 [Xylariaceae sp. FL1272]|nr:cytochrome P450 [Xylariaceae sp. FL1272]
METTPQLRATLLSLGKYAIIILIPYLSIHATFYIFFHPLRRYPGPLIAKFSDIYNGFYAYKRKLHKKTWQNHLQYGPIVRQGPNKLVFSSIAAIQDIYKGDKTTKSTAYIALGPGLTSPTTITALDRDLHRSRRQLIGQALSDRFLRTFEPIMSEQIDLFIHRLSLSANTPAAVDITEYSRHLGIDLAGLLGFGYTLNLQTAEENRFILPMLDARALWSSIFLHWPNSRRFRAGLIFVPIFRSVRTQYLSLMEKMITLRTTQRDDAYHDFYKVVKDSLDSESEGLRQSDLWAEANLFFPAAGETTKTAVSAAFFYLSSYPACQEKLAREIRTTFTSASQINGQTLSNCTFLRACIDEALRMSPPAAGILWREPYDSADEKPFVVDGQVIPPGTTVGVNIYSIHYNDEYFPDSFTFRPERWLDDETSQRKVMRDAFMPFSVGPRGCAGKSMAYLEISILLAKTIWHFDFQPSSEGLSASDTEMNQPVFKLFDNFTASHDGPYLSFRKRPDQFGNTQTSAS